MSSKEIPYSWNSARAIRCRTNSLGVSLTSFVPEMKSRMKPSRTTSVSSTVWLAATPTVAASALVVRLRRSLRFSAVGDDPLLIRINLGAFILRPVYILAMETTPAAELETRRLLFWAAV